MLTRSSSRKRKYAEEGVGEGSLLGPGAEPSTQASLAARREQPQPHYAAGASLAVRAAAAAVEANAAAGAAEPEQAPSPVEAAGGAAAAAAGGDRSGLPARQGPPVGMRVEAKRAHTVKHVHEARRQHTTSLLAMLRQYAAQRNLPRLAQVASLLLVAQGPGAVKSSGEGQGSPSEAQLRLAEVLSTAYSAISTSWPPLASTGASSAAVTAPPTTDQLRRLLRQAHSFQPQAAGRDGVAMELARLTLQQGDLSAAYDVLSAIPARGDSSPLEYDRSLLLGLIRHAQWIQAMQRSEPRRLAGGGGFDGLSFDPSQWARAGRVARELFADAGEHLKRAYRLRPATELAYLMAQRTLATEGGAAAASRVAQQHRQVAPGDVDAHALHALLLVMLGARSGSGAPANSTGRSSDDEGTSSDGRDAEPGTAAARRAAAGAAGAELAVCLEAMLRCDPCNEVAAAAVLELDGEGALPPSHMLQLLRALLDGAPRSLNPPPLQLQAWQALAAGVSEAAERLVSAHSAVRQTQQVLKRHLASLVPAAAPAQQQQEARELSEEGGVEASEGQGGGAGLDPADADRLYGQLGRQQRALEAAVQAWQEVGECLTGSLWWRSHHFVPPQPEAFVVLALRTRRAAAAALEAQGVVAAAAHGLWVQEQLHAVRSGCPLPASMHSTFARMALRVLRQHGGSAEVERLGAALDSINQAFRLARGRERQQPLAALGVLAHLSRHRADFWRAARKPWVPPAGWLPASLGLPHPRLGPAASQLPAWWRTFPQARRGGAGGGQPNV